MKILFLSAEINAQHEFSRRFEQKGIQAIFVQEPSEALRVALFHASALDLIWIQRELEGAMEFLTEFKKNPNLHDIPFIISTSQWSDTECAQHQKTDLGANAYIKWPADAESCSNLICAVLGEEPSEKVVSPPALNHFPSKIDIQRPKEPVNAAPPTDQRQTSAQKMVAPSGGGPVLEDATEMFMGSVSKKGENSIMLEAPSNALQQNASHVSPPPLPQQVETVKDEISLSNGIPIELDASTHVTNPNEALASEISLHDESHPPAQSSDESSGIALEISEEAQEEFSIETHQSTVESIETEHENESPQEMSVAEQLAEAHAQFEHEEEEYSAPSQIFSPHLEPPINGEHSQALQNLGMAKNINLNEDQNLKQNMPYIFEENQKLAEAILSPAQPLGDAIVPGGMSETPDEETLRKYLLLREQDVGILSNKLNEAKREIKELNEQITVLKAANSEYSHELKEAEKKLNDVDLETHHRLESLEQERDDLEFELKKKKDKIKLFERKIEGATEEMEQLKERVRNDIRKIRMRERDLENRIEILKKDSEVLIDARDNKIIELKRKLDLLEFNMDLLQDQYSREKSVNKQLKEKLEHASKAMRVAEGFLEEAS